MNEPKRPDFKVIMILVLFLVCFYFAMKLFAVVSLNPTTTLLQQKADAVSSVPVRRLMFDGYRGIVLVRYKPTRHITADLRAIKAHGFDGAIVPHPGSTLLHDAHTVQLHVYDQELPDSAAHIQANVSDCGRQWFNNLVDLNHYYLHEPQLNAVEVDGWAQVAQGVDTCSHLTAAVADDVLTFDTTAPTPSISHFTVFISQDGIHLTSLIDIAASARSLDLHRFAFSAGTYYLYVKLVGQPLVQNHISAVVKYVRH